MDSPTGTWLAEIQEEARVPPVECTTQINSMMVPYPVSDIAAGDLNVVREPTRIVLPKLRPFDKDHANIWFIQAEASMNLARITSDTMKFYYILTELDPDIFYLVEDLAERPPATDKYPAIKNRLLHLFGQTIESKVRHLFTCKRGNEKPSHFLQRLKSLAGRNVSDVLLRVIFLEQLPDTLRDILLAREDDTDLFELALLADRLIEIEVPVSTPSQSNTAKENNMTAMCQALSQQITKLANQLEDLKIECSRQHGHQPRQRSNSRSSSAQRRSQSRERNTTGLCYYHRRFGARAYRCSVPCTW